MSLFDSASLVVTPNGVKEGKLYSIKPTDGSGDLSVTRATTATRVNSAGLVELVPYNLLTYSNTFSNSDWQKGSTITLTGSQTGYDGSNNAWLISKVAIQYTDIGQSISSSGTKTLSVYAKANTNTKICLFASSSPSNFYQDFDLSNGTLGPNSFGSVSTLIENVGNGWYRCSVVFSGDTTYFAIFPDNILGANAGSVYIQNAQIVSGSVAKEYFPTTTRLNIPRLDYTNSTCPSILVEPQRTNLLTYSNDFTNAIWTKDNVSLTSGITSPSGINNAFKLIESATTGVHSIYQTFVTLPSSVYSTSMYVKKGERFKVAIADRNTGIYVAFNLNTGTIIASNSLIGKIELLNNDWYRLTVTTSSAITVYVPQFFILDDAYTTGFPILQPYAGNGTSGVFISFSQLEAGSYATSYIPTTSASVTRNADVFSVSLPNTDMTFCAYLELDEPTLGGFSNDWLQIYSDVSVNGRGYGYAQVVGFANDYNLGVDASTSRKIIWKQESGSNAKMFLDGVLFATSTTGTYSNPFNRFSIIGTNLSKPAKIKMFTFFDENLTDAQCIELTTL